MGDFYFIFWGGFYFFFKLQWAFFPATKRIKQQKSGVFFYPTGGRGVTVVRGKSQNRVRTGIGLFIGEDTGKKTIKLLLRGGGG